MAPLCSECRFTGFIALNLLLYVQYLWHMPQLTSVLTHEWEAGHSGTM
jgi:hypothetical protein